ncbi:MAG TPA: hypothetical protein VFC19_48255 [Candidatus Limnocylindrales bacterium]|nr:hypothetical protein [Candidatus Limnocylindrales bacterium]
MRTKLWAWLSRLVVRLYPRELRERYGQEVEGLLSRSTSARDQARDLADVAWCAALERADGITFAGMRRGMLRSVALAALVPVATFVWVALAVMASIMFPSMMMPDRWWTLWITLVYTVMPAFVLTPLAFLVSRLLARAWTLPPVVVAGCMAAGAFGSAGVPGAGTVLGEVLAPALAAIGVWLVGMLALVAVSGALTARVPRVVAVPAVMVMAYVVLSAATAAFAVTLRTFEASMWAWSPLWYPIALTGGESMDYVQVWPAYDNTKFLPQVLTLLTVFVVSWRPGSHSDVLSNPKDLIAA